MIPVLRFSVTTLIRMYPIYQGLMSHVILQYTHASCLKDSMFVLFICSLEMTLVSGLFSDTVQILAVFTAISTKRIIRPTRPRPTSSAPWPSFMVDKFQRAQFVCGC